MRLKLFTLFLFTPFFSSLLQAQNISSEIAIKKIIVGEEILTSNANQLVEVTLLNSSNKDFNLLLKLDVTLPNGQNNSFGSKKLMLGQTSEEKVIFNYPIKKNKRGLYKIGVRLFTSNGRNLLLKARPDQLAFFNVASLADKGKIKNKTSQAADTPATKSEVVFEPPDLLWEEVRIAKTSLLRGENTVVRMILSNDGGNVIKDIEYSLHWFFKQRPLRKVLQYKDAIKIMAPGESKVFEIPLTIPGTERKGFYRVQATVKELNSTADLKVKNNVMESSNEVKFGDISLEFPEDNYAFAEDGLFLFQWRSIRYNQFKVQVSTDEKFENPDGILEMPQGDKWTSKQNITPLVGEMPIMALSLMNNAKTDHLYWRVLARNTDGEQTVSEQKKFFITLSAGQ